MTGRTLKRSTSVMAAFILFGFVDNFFLVMFAWIIDAFFIKIGVENAMLIASLSNTLSDALGILIGRFAEQFIHSKISTKEEVLTRKEVIMSEILGITFGCFLGMIPLIFLFRG